MKVNIIENGRVTTIEIAVSDEFVAAAKLLPEDWSRYFTFPDNTKIFGIDQLINTRARANGIRNGLLLMRQAYEGLTEKRKPLCIESLHNNRYKVIDGNSTLIIALAAGWNELPCLLS